MISVKKLLNFSKDILIKAGFPSLDAEIIADSLVQADCAGISSHGLARLNLYIERAENNALNKKPEIKIVQENNSTVLIDADNGMGVLAAKKAVKLVVEKASKFGIALAGIKNSNHLGALSYVTDLIQKKGFIGFAASNTSPIMAPFGGREAVLGNNPFSVAIPHNPPIIFDTALSITARGNIILAEREGKPIPEGWAVDREGKLTTDPKEALLGAVLPMAQHKGYGMALILDILCGVLTGAEYSINLGSFVPPDYTKPLGFGHIVLAINIESFIKKELFEERLENQIKIIKESNLQEGFAEILIPGERRNKSIQRSLQEGLNLKETTMEKLKELSEKYEVKTDLLF